MIPAIDSTVEFLQRSLIRSAIFSDGTALALTTTYNLSEDLFGEPVYGIEWFNEKHEDMPTPEWARDLSGDDLDTMLGTELYDNKFPRVNKHVGHTIAITQISNNEVSIECTSPCGEVLLDFIED